MDTDTKWYRTTKKRVFPPSLAVAVAVALMGFTQSAWADGWDYDDHQQGLTRVSGDYDTTPSSSSDAASSADWDFDDHHLSATRVCDAIDRADSTGGSPVYDWDYDVYFYRTDSVQTHGVALSQYE